MEFIKALKSNNEFNLFFSSLPLDYKKSIIKYCKMSFSLNNIYFDVSFNELIKRREKIILLSEFFNQNMIFSYSKYSWVIFYDYIYDILTEHLNYIKSYIFHFPNTFEFDEKFFLNWLKKARKESISFKNWILDFFFWINRSMYVEDMYNSLTLMCYYKNNLVFSGSFYIWNRCLLISNIQYYSIKYNNMILKSYSLHSIFLSLVYSFYENYKLKNVLWFSNLIHPCNYHNWFKGNYDSIFLSYWFEILDNNFYELKDVWKYYQKIKRYNFLKNFVYGFKDS